MRVAGIDVGRVLRGYSPGQLAVRVAEEYVWWLLRGLPGFGGLYLRYLFLKVCAARVDGFCWISQGCTVSNSYGISIGKQFATGRNVLLDGRGGLEIGDHVGIGHNCVVIAAEHSMVSRDPMGNEGQRVKPIRIGSNVWIGANSFVKAGVTIGDDAVVAACSNLMSDVPERGWMIGSPARPFPQAMRELRAGARPARPSAPSGGDR